MLYNESTGKPKVQADVFSLESLIAWLEKMPPKAEYDWSRAESCVLGQWCAANGLEGRQLFDKSLELGCWSRGNGQFAEVALGDLRNCTFGAALTRARKAAQAS